ncbi:tigger transposable element-derived protein 7-like [Periplaneta americana]|uniref:tigger transposable element-derived protein 7-like n=1 Tax=Periplaneta americana TaxID=6978 RepID=UPI0037E703F4
MAREPKRKRVVLSIADKLEIISRLEAGASVAAVAGEYGLGLTTVKDLRRNKDRLRQFANTYDAGGVSARKTLKLPTDTNLEVAVYRWYIQQRATGVAVRGVDIQAAAERLAKQLKIPNFSASCGWLWRFRNRHSITKEGHGKKALEFFNKQAEVESHTLRKNIEEVKEEEEEDDKATPEKLAEVRAHVDEVVNFIDSSSDPALEAYGVHFRTFKELIILREKQAISQSNMHGFFKPPPVSKSVARESGDEQNHPSTSKTVSRSNKDNNRNISDVIKTETE